MAVEAVIAAAGGFDDIDAATTSQLATWQLRSGVEAGKVAAYALMGRAGYEQRRTEIEASMIEVRRLV